MSPQVIFRYFPWRLWMLWLSKSIYICNPIHDDPQNQFYVSLTQNSCLFSLHVLGQWQNRKCVAGVLEAAYKGITSTFKMGAVFDPWKFSHMSWNSANHLTTFLCHQKHPWSDNKWILCHWALTRTSFVLKNRNVYLVTHILTHMSAIIILLDTI